MNVAERVALTVLLIVALALRWWRLDLMPFRYDAAEALARTREILALGHPPLTGIVNSLGFRNPAGLEWLILPAALFSPDPRVAAGWCAVLVVSGVVALWWIGRHLGGTAVGWAWALLYAFLPQVVFSSRDVWAQHLLIPLGAWALAFALRGCRGDETPRTVHAESERALLGAVAMAAVATLVHLCALPWLIGLCVWFAWRWWRGARAERRSRRRVVPFLLLLGATVLALTPSLLDFVRLRLHPPTTKPPHVAKFEALAPPPKPLLSRVGEAYAGLFDPLASVGTLSGIETVMPPVWTRGMRAIDVVLLAAALGGLAPLLLLGAGRLRALGHVKSAAEAAAPPSFPSGAFAIPPAAALLVLAWLLLPPAVAAVGVRYPNGTYFYFALPALLLLPVLGVGVCVQGLTRLLERKAKDEARGGLPETQSPGLWLARCGLVGVFALLALFDAAFFMRAMRDLERARVVDGPYYTPLREQLGLAREFDRAGVGRGHLVHLGGAWFQRSYDYLLEAVLDVPMRPGAVVMEDLFLRRSQPTRRAFIERNLSRSWATIRWDLFPTLADAWRFADRFYALPVERGPANNDRPSQ